MRLTAAVALLALLFAPLAAHADTTGALNGRVVDFKTQLPIVGVEVHAISLSDQRVTHTDARGNFVFLGLLPGHYEVSFTHRLYAPNIFTALVIQSGEEIHVLVALKRVFYTLDGDFWVIPVGWLVRPGVTADVYRFNTRVPGVGAPGSAFGFFPYVPGLTLGGAPRMMR